jgi:hypothetical protein
MGPDLVDDAAAALEAGHERRVRPSPPPARPAAPRRLAEARGLSCSTCAIRPPISRSAPAIRGRASGCSPSAPIVRWARCTRPSRSRGPCSERGVAADFRATGQTGILIAGAGVAVDAVVADFISGAIEQLAPARDDDGWDVIEGQGSLFHPSFAGVSLGLLHGAQPEALVLCHEPGRPHMRGLPGARPGPRRMPGAQSGGGAADQPGRARGRHLPQHLGHGAGGRTRLCAETSEDRLGLPCTDPIAFGVEPIIDLLLCAAPSTRSTTLPAEPPLPHLARREDGGGRDHRDDPGRRQSRARRGVPYPRYGESPESALAADRARRASSSKGRRPVDLLDALEPGAARNALDCALWDLEASLGARSVAEHDRTTRAGQSPPR